MIYSLSLASVRHCVALIDPSRRVHRTSQVRIRASDSQFQILTLFKRLMSPTGVSVPLERLRETILGFL